MIKKVRERDKITELLLLPEDCDTSGGEDSVRESVGEVRLERGEGVLTTGRVLDGTAGVREEREPVLVS